MSTYYEMLNINSDASSTEIEAAFDEQYNKWRRLVTHHDPQVVEEANRSLRTLEQIRETLTNAANRKIYDQSLRVGGLADPEALLKSVGTGKGGTTMTPPAPQHQSPRASAAPGVSWVCTKCNTANNVGTMFCTKCGNAVGQKCPKCEVIVAIDAQFCSGCGTDVEQEKRDLTEKATEAWKHQQKQQIQSYQTQIKVHQYPIYQLKAIKGNRFPIFGLGVDAYSLLGLSAIDMGHIGGLLLGCALICGLSGYLLFTGTGFVTSLIILLVGCGVTAWIVNYFLVQDIAKAADQKIVEQESAIRKLEKQITEVQRQKFEDSHYGQQVKNQDWKNLRTYGLRYVG